MVIPTPIIIQPHASCQIVSSQGKIIRFKWKFIHSLFRNFRIKQRKFEISAEMLGMMGGGIRVCFIVQWCVISFVQSEDQSLAGDGSGEAETDTRDGYQEEMRAGTHFRLQTPHQNTKQKPQTIHMFSSSIGRICFISRGCQRVLIFNFNKEILFYI